MSLLLSHYRSQKNYSAHAFSSRIWPGKSTKPQGYWPKMLTGQELFFARPESKREPYFLTVLHEFNFCLINLFEQVLKDVKRRFNSIQFNKTFIPYSCRKEKKRKEN